MPVSSTERKQLSEVLLGVTDIQMNQGINYHFAGVDVKSAVDVAVEPIGLLLKYSDADSAFVPLEPNAAWAASTAYAEGDVVRPTAQNGLEYVAIVAGTSDASEPTFPAVVGATVTDGTVTWLARMPYSAALNSPLPNKASICVAMGSQEGVGINKADVDLSTTAVELQVLFRGIGGLVEDLMVSGSGDFTAMSADDQAEIKTALELLDIAVEAAAETVDSSYVS